MKAAEYALRPARSYDWESIKIRYVEGVTENDDKRWPTLNEVADHFEVAHQRVKEVAAKQRWRDERGAFQAQVQRERRAARAREMVEQAVELDSRALSAAKMGLQLIAVRLNEIAKATRERQAQRQELERRILAALPIDDFTDLGEPTVEAREMDTLARAADTWHRVGARALGEVPTMRTELSGPAGQPLEVAATIRGELARDDTRRLAGVLAVASRAGLLGILGPDGDDGVVDADVIGDDGEEDPAAQRDGEGHGGGPAPGDAGGADPPAV